MLLSLDGNYAAEVNGHFTDQFRVKCRSAFLDSDPTVSQLQLSGKLSVKGVKQGMEYVHWICFVFVFCIPFEIMLISFALDCFCSLFVLGPPWYAVQEGTHFGVWLFG